jgi:hypothetical protein
MQSNESVPGKEGGLVPFLPSRDDFELTVRAVEALGLDPDQVPSYEDVISGLDDKVLEFMKEQAGKGAPAEAVVNFPLTEENPLPELARKYEATVRELNPGKWAGAVFRSEVWADPVPAAINNVNPGGIQINYELLDTVEPLAPEIKLDSPGLVYGQKHVKQGEEMVPVALAADEQAALFNHDRDELASQGISLELMTPQEFLVKATKRALKGELSATEPASGARALQYEPRSKQVSKLNKDKRLETRTVYQHPTLETGSLSIGFGSAGSEVANPTLGIRRVVRTYVERLALPEAE